MRFFPAIIGLALFLFCACGEFRQHTNPLTSVPGPVVKETVDFDESEQDAGMKGYDSTGYTVSDGWLRKYRRLLELHWKQLPARKQIKPSDYMLGIEARGPHRYHITFEVFSRYSSLDFIDINPAYAH